MVASGSCVANTGARGRGIATTRGIATALLESNARSACAARPLSVQDRRDHEDRAQTDAVSDENDLAWKHQHEHHRLREFVAYLRAQGRDVSDPEWDDPPDAWVQLDGQRTALELTGGYVGKPAELWNPPAPIPFNVNASSSGASAFAQQRQVDAARLQSLIAHLNERLTVKCRHDYPRAYLVLDPSHDQLAPELSVDDVIKGLQVPAGCRFTGIYVVVPRFDTPRRFVLLHGAP